ncbi:MAG: hypothetical protein JO340_10290 [Acidobacteriaceae bacterium]|nr:hypothetical protein [Acidobacteriaceae bacterium]
MTGREARLHGTLRAVLLFDIAEEIDLTRLHDLVGTSPRRREPAFRGPAPEYVRFERTPVVENLPPCFTSARDALQTRVRYFQYGVASVELIAPFQGDWQRLIHLANRWIISPELEQQARALLASRLGQLQDILIKPYPNWISEDYYVIQVDPIGDGAPIPADELIRHCGAQIAQIVRGEESPLSDAERDEVLQSRISYYPADLLVVGWVAAFVYDTPAAAIPTLDLLEYANTQLLEFRYYDEVLTKVLANVYRQIDVKRGFFSAWRLAREAAELNTIRLDYRELSERTENAIKFLSDMFYARVYRLAAARIGVNDYRSLVAEKLTTARDLYESMVNEFHQQRAFFLELMVVIILIIEIVFLFRGKG